MNYYSVELYVKYLSPTGILLVVALGVALGIFSGGIMLTFVSMFMKR